MAEENIKELTVSLISEDITRAAVKEEEFGKLTVNQLKCWLKCRRFSQSGNRQVIVLLCLSFFLRSHIRLCHVCNPSFVISYRVQNVYDPDKDKSYTKAKATKCRKKCGKQQIF